MINSPIRLLDNTGCLVYSENDHFMVVGTIAGFDNFNCKDHNNTTFPYLCKNKTDYEIGIGKIVCQEDKIIINKERIISSSKNSKFIIFSKTDTNYLYCFANSINFNTAFNNLIEISDNYVANNCKATYIVDISSKDIAVTLPEASLNHSLAIEFQTSTGDYSLDIYDSNNLLVVTLFANHYCKLISSGKSWIKMNTTNNSINTLSSATAGFSTMNTLAAGGSGSLQYNAGQYLAGSDIYIDNVNNQLLFGSTTSSNATSIIPFSGVSSTIFNNLRGASDFIVRGSGDKSLFFGHEGRLGINIPSGSRPQTSLHIINNACQEAIRLENRNQCYPANLTLYHKPSTLPENNSTAATINLSGKNSSNNQIEYVQLRSRILSANAVSTSGEFAIATEKLGNRIESIITNADKTNIIAGTNSISVSTSGIQLSGDVSISSLKWPTSNISGQLLMSDGNNNIVLTSPNDSSIIDLLDAGIVVFTGVCT